MLIATSFMPFSAAAAAQGATPEFGFAETPYALASVRGVNVSNELRQILAQNDIGIANNTLIEVLPSNAAEGANVLLVSNMQGNTVKKDMLVSISQDGNIGSFLPLVKSVNSETRATGSGDETLPGGSVCLHFFATYNTPTGSDSKVQPVSVRFRYLDYDGTHSVTQAKVVYKTRGVEYTYPGGVQITTGGHMFEYTITVSHRSPVASQSYSKSNPYRTDRVIDVSNGVSTHIFEWQVTVDGSLYSDATPIS